MVQTQSIGWTVSYWTKGEFILFFSLLDWLLLAIFSTPSSQQPLYLYALHLPPCKFFLFSCWHASSGSGSIQ